MKISTKLHDYDERINIKKIENNVSILKTTMALYDVKIKENAIVDYRNTYLDDVMQKLYRPDIPQVKRDKVLFKDQTNSTEEYYLFQLYNFDVYNENGVFFDITFKVFKQFSDAWNDEIKYKEDVRNELKMHISSDTAAIVIDYIGHSTTDEEFTESLLKNHSTTLTADDFGRNIGGPWEHYNALLGKNDKEYQDLLLDVPLFKYIKCMCYLPYPREAIKQIISSKKSVREINFICEWFKRKIECMKRMKKYIPE